MTAVTVIGGSGYAGAHIVEAAAVRGLEVTSFTRGEVAEQVAGVRYLRGSVTDATDRARALRGAEVVIVAVSPRGEMQDKVRSTVAELASEAQAAGARLVIIGGAGSLLQTEGGELVMNAAGFPAEFRAEAAEMGAVLEDLRAAPAGLDWVYISPAAGFGPMAAGEYRGEYRVGGDVLLVDDAGESQISGADFGVAVVDEIEAADHTRERISFAY